MRCSGTEKCFPLGHMYRLKTSNVGNNSQNSWSKSVICGLIQCLCQAAFQLAVQFANSRKTCLFFQIQGSISKEIRITIQNIIVKDNTWESIPEVCSLYFLLIWINQHKKEEFKITGLKTIIPFLPFTAP